MDEMFIIPKLFFFFRENEDVDRRFIEYSLESDFYYKNLLFGL